MLNNTPVSETVAVSVVNVSSSMPWPRRPLGVRQILFLQRSSNCSFNPHRLRSWLSFPSLELFLLGLLDSSRQHRKSLFVPQNKNGAHVKTFSFSPSISCSGVLSFACYFFLSDLNACD
jgi:hypothetical protein